MGAYRVHKAASPFYAADLDEVDFVQQANTITFVHLDYAVRELTRVSHTEWAIESVTFAPAIGPPANVAAAPTQPNATGAIAVNYIYYVTTIDENGEESRASTSDNASNDLSLQGNYNTVTWDAVTGAAFYAVFRGDNGSPGYIGTVQAPAVTFKDRNLQAVLSDTPPLATNPFAAAGDYPSTVTCHQQRKFFGRTRNRPNAIWASQSANPENMDVSRPAKADDALAFALVTEKVNSVNQLASMKKDLMVFGGDAIFSIKGGDGGALTPSAIDPQRESGRGSSRLNPLVVDSVMFYDPIRSSGPRALGFTFEVDGYRSNNISIFSPHFFKAHEIVDWAYQGEPYSCIWAVREDGVLLCFTWEEEHQVWGWTLCETDGFVERVAVIAEGRYDRLYALIRRTINGVERRFHEWLALPHFDDITTACHLDCAVTQTSEVASDIIDQLWHLEGATVSAVYDGYVVEGLVVEEGKVTLPYAANIRTAGLPYEGLIETLPFALGDKHTERQIIGAVTLRALETRGLEISTDGETFDPLTSPDGEEIAQLPYAEEQDFQAVPQGNWTDGSTLTIRQAQPLPAHVTAIFVELIVSDDPK